MARKNSPEQLITQYDRIFIDTCSFMNFNITSFIEQVIPTLQQEGKKIILTYRCYGELIDKSRNGNEGAVRGAKRGLEVIQRLQEKQLLDIFGSSSDQFADNVFQTVFTQKRLLYSMLLITQDKGLAHDILLLNESKSSRGKKVMAKQLIQGGLLGDYDDRAESVNRTSQPVQIRKKTNIVSDAPENERFRVYTQITTETDKPREWYPLREQGGFYLSQCDKAYRIGSKLASGGEGTVYEVTPKCVMKVYSQAANTVYRKRKIDKMLQKKLSNGSICFPSGWICARDQDTEHFAEVGYYMIRAKGEELQKSVFCPKAVFLRKHPDWTKRDMVQLAITILEKIKYLHDRNIIIGDINPNNIMVVSPTEVYFVDTDSYQIEDIPCPVGTTAFTAPEIQGKPFGSFLRTKGNENFAIAVLLFMLMLPGKHPYSQQGSEDMVTNIMKMEFPYAYGENFYGKMPEGLWRFCWSHLPYRIKEAFYQTFQKGEPLSTEDKRHGVDEWLELFIEYRRLLDEGVLQDNDPMCMEIFPVRNKLSKDAERKTCRFCGKETPVAAKTKEVVCYDCWKRGASYRCIDCGTEVTYRFADEYLKNSKYDRCPDCRQIFQEKKRAEEKAFDESIYCIRECVECHSKYHITQGEYKYYQSKQFKLPRRCPACRGKKNDSFQVIASSSLGKTTASGPKTTAKAPVNTVVQKVEPRSQTVTVKKLDVDPRNGYIYNVMRSGLGMLSNCMELHSLQTFRDNFLAYQPNGQTMIRKYYDASLSINTGIFHGPRYELWCRYLWANYIEPGLNLIKQGQLQACEQLLIKMHREMCARFCQ